MKLSFSSTATSPFHTGRITATKVNRFALALFVASLLPLLAMAFFDHPSIDDFVFGAQTHEAIQEGLPTLDVLKTATHQTAQIYQRWQGSFAAVFLFAFQPAVFSESLYWVVPLLMIGVFLLSSFFFLKVLCVDIFGASKPVWSLVSILIAGVSIQTLPSPVQGFYWYNGAVYYTFFYAVGLFLWGWLLQERFRGPSWVRKGGILLFSVLVGGGNYVTALVSILLLSSWVLLYLFRKERGRWFYLFVLAVLAGSFLLSAVAPGNEIRAQRYVGLSAVDTILRALYYGFHFLWAWSDPLFWGISIPLAILFWRMAGRVRWRFRFPLLVSVVAFGLFSAQFTPALYGMGSYGEGRILNIIYFAFWLLWSAQLFYWCGWLRQKVERYCSNHQICWRSLQVLLRTAARRSVPFLAAILLLGCGLRLAKNDPASWDGLTSASAVYSLVSGEAATYHQEYRNRLQILEDPSIQHVEFSPYTRRPYLLYYGDLTGKVDYPWSNQAMARYYHKESVRVNWKNT